LAARNHLHPKKKSATKTFLTRAQICNRDQHHHHHHHPSSSKHSLLPTLCIWDLQLENSGETESCSCQYLSLEPLFKKSWFWHPNCARWWRKGAEVSANFFDSPTFPWVTTAETLLEGVEWAPAFRDFGTMVISGLVGFEQKDDGRGRGHSR
jgi:hypothetical protein